MAYYNSNLAARRRHGGSGAAMMPCLFETFGRRRRITCSKNPRCGRRADFALTYAAMTTLSGRYAEAPAELGLKPDDGVAAQVENSVEALMLYLGGIPIGAIFLPLDTAYTSAELDYFLGDAEPKLLVCDPTRRDGLAPVEARVAPGARLDENRCASRAPNVA
jgi:acyl-coenzyme A synthetase/AMP-(fatty) acid ligase